MARLLGIVGAAAIGSCILTASAQRAIDSSKPDPDDPDRVIVVGMVPIPDVGPGAPRFTAQEVRELQQAATRAHNVARGDLRKCGAVMGAGNCNPSAGIMGVLSCEAEAAYKARNLAGKAAQATAVAEDARSRAAQGKATMAEVEVAELARQEAVKKMEKARQDLMESQAQTADMQDFMLKHTAEVRVGDGSKGAAFEKKATIDRLNSEMSMDLTAKSMKREKAGWGLGGATPARPPGLTLEKIRIVRLKDTKGEFLKVSGEIRNASPSGSSEVPGLSVTLTDVKGFPLNTTTVFADGAGKISAGQSRPFQVFVRPAFDGTRNAVVTFASASAPPPRIHTNALICDMK
jgi:hypothetical protein